MASVKIPVFRLRALDQELGEMLQEADSRCATAFSLQLDDMRERLATSALNAIGKSEARIMRRHADRDPSGHLKASERTGGLQWSNPDAQERMTEEMAELQTSMYEIDAAVLEPKLKKSQLVANGLAVSGARMANLRPVLDLEALDEPIPSDRSAIILQPPRGIPHA